MKVDVYLDIDDALISIKSLSDWFTDEKVIPNLNEHLFTNENEKDQDDYSGSCEWVVVKKFYDQYHNTVMIYFMDVNNIKP